MGPPEIRAVAFLDVLGFKQLIVEAESKQSTRNKLAALKQVIENHTTWDNDGLAPTVPNLVKPKYLFASDSIILSVPQRCQDFDGLAIVALKSIEIAHKVLELGFLLRGYVTVGNLWHEDRNIFGTAFMEAYAKEKGVRAPRIELSPKAVTHLDQATHKGSPLRELGCWTTTGSRVFLDTFNPYYIRGIDMHGRMESAYQQYRSFIVTGLEASDLPFGANAKWRKTRRYFNESIVRHSVNTQPIKWTFRMTQEMSTSLLRSIVGAGRRTLKCIGSNR